MYQLEFIPGGEIPSKKKENLIIFLHGLVGGQSTWIRGDGQFSILDYLYSDPCIRQQYDFAVYSYFTQFSDLLTRILYFLNKIYFKSNKSFQHNLSIKQISRILKADITASGYKNIFFVTHSMGGLVAKDVILQLIRDRQDKRRQPNESPMPETKLYVSLVVPHEGAILAFLSKLGFKSRQLKNLQPLDEYKKDLSAGWQDNLDKLPTTLYFRGLNDWVVPETAAFPYDARRNAYTYDTEFDHFAIVCPGNKDHTVVKLIKKQLYEKAGLEACTDAEPIKSVRSFPEKDPPKTKIRLFPWLITMTVLGYFLYHAIPWPLSKANYIKQVGLKGFRCFKDSPVDLQIADFFDSVKIVKYKLSLMNMDSILDKCTHKKEQLSDPELETHFDKTESSGVVILKFYTPGGPTDSTLSGFVIQLSEAGYSKFVPTNNLDWRKLSGANELVSIKPVGDTATLRLLK